MDLLTNHDQLSFWALNSMGSEYCKWPVDPGPWTLDPGPWTLDSFYEKKKNSHPKEILGHSLHPKQMRTPKNKEK